MSMYPDTAPSSGDEIGDSLRKINQILNASGGGSGGGDASAANQQKQLTGLPYGADKQVITYVTAGPATIAYSIAGVTQKTRTFTYENAGVNSTDRLLQTADT